MSSTSRRLSRLRFTPLEEFVKERVVDSFDSAVISTARNWAHSRPEQFDGADRLTCDECGAPASHVHWQPWVTNPTVCIFGCREHDHGGYRLRLSQMDPRVGTSDWDNSTQRYSMVDHVLDKGATLAISMYLHRLEDARTGEQ